VKPERLPAIAARVTAAVPVRTIVAAVDVGIFNRAAT